MKKSTIILFTIATLFSSITSAMCPEEKGRMLAKQIEAVSSGWGDVESTMIMTIRSSNGKENTMTMRSQSLELKGNGDKSLLTFESPMSVKGTKLLSYSFIKEDDEQWIYIPKTDKSKRIAGKKRSGSFLGSQFSFEDLTAFKFDKYRYRSEKQENCGEETCDILESYPEYKGSGYSKLLLWVDEKSRIKKVEYYDLDRELLKTLTIKSYARIDDKFWQPNQSEMINHTNGKSTEIKIKDIKRNNGFDLSMFDKF